MQKRKESGKNDSVEQSMKIEHGQDIEPQRAADKPEKRGSDKNPDDFE
jgi:hypothetical protein